MSDEKHQRHINDTEASTEDVAAEMDNTEGGNQQAEVNLADAVDQYGEPLYDDDGDPIYHDRTAKGDPGSDDAPRARLLVADYIERAYAFYPSGATYLGLHQYDGKAPDFSRESLDRRIAELGGFLSTIESINRDHLHAGAESFDFDLVRYDAEFELFRLTEQRTYEESPIAYDTFDVSSYLKRDYAPLQARVRLALEYLRAGQANLDHAEANLDEQLSASLLQVALLVYGGYLTYYAEDGEFFQAIKPVGNTALIEEAHEVAAQLRARLERMVEWLKGKQATASTDFALGADRYRQLVRRQELLDIPLADMLRVGEENLQKNKSRLQELVAQKMPGLSVPAAIKELAKNRPTSESLIEDGQQTLEAIRKYIVQHDLITIPSEVRCVVEETPAFHSWSFASMDTPGPFEAVATQAYYYITRPAADLPEEKKEEWLSQFAYPILEDISIHEAYPGHYVQFLHMQNAPSNAAKSIFNYAFIEGWAHYCEQMLVEAGYGKDQVVAEIAQLLEALVRNVRFVCSIRMHTQGMTVEEATDRFINDAFMEHESGASEARRGTFDPGYFAYTLGKLQILKLREDYKAEQELDGVEFSLKQFHNKLLSFGSPPVALLRRQLLLLDDGATLLAYDSCVGAG